MTKTLLRIVAVVLVSSLATDDVSGSLFLVSSLTRNQELETRNAFSFESETLALHPEAQIGPARALVSRLLSTPAWLSDYRQAIERIGFAHPLPTAPDPDLFTEIFDGLGLQLQRDIRNENSGANQKRLQQAARYALAGMAFVLEGMHQKAPPRGVRVISNEVSTKGHRIIWLLYSESGRAIQTQIKIRIGPTPLLTMTFYEIKPGKRKKTELGVIRFGVDDGRPLHLDISSTLSSRWPKGQYWKHHFNVDAWGPPDDPETILRFNQWVVELGRKAELWEPFESDSSEHVLNAAALAHHYWREAADPHQVRMDLWFDAMSLLGKSVSDVSSEITQRLFGVAYPAALVPILHCLPFTQYYTVRYESNLSAVMAALQAGSDPILDAMLVYAVGRYHLRVGHWSQIAGHLSERLKEFESALLQTLQIKQGQGTNHVRILIPGVAFGQEAFFWVWIIRCIRKQYPEYARFQFRIIGLEKDLPVYQLADQKAHQEGLDLIDIFGFNSGGDPEAIQLSKEILSDAQRYPSEYSAMIEVQQDTIPSPHFQALVNDSDLISWNYIWYTLSREAKTEIKAVLSQAIAVNPRLKIVGLDTKETDFKISPAVPAELRRQGQIPAPNPTVRPPQVRVRAKEVHPEKAAGRKEIADKLQQILARLGLTAEEAQSIIEYGASLHDHVPEAEAFVRAEIPPDRQAWVKAQWEKLPELLSSLRRPKRGDKISAPAAPARRPMPQAEFGAA